jgi:hypothetical protein
LGGETEFSAQVTVLFTPTVTVVTSAHEMEVLRQMSLLNGTNVEQLSTSISSHHTEADINTLVNLHASSMQHASRSDWTAMGTIAAGVVFTLFIFYYFTHPYISNLLKNCTTTCDKRGNAGVQKPQVENPSPSHPNSSSAVGENLTEVNPQVRYSVYSLQSA